MSKILAAIVCWFMPTKHLRREVRDIFRFGVFKYLRALSQSRAKGPEPEYFLAVCAVAKNEGAYFKEWLEYHKLVGVEKFYIYDNESTDNTKDVLAPYIEAGLVEYRYWPGYKQQDSVYNHSLNTHKYESRWLAFIDLDEFMVPVEAGTVPDILRPLPQDVSQLLMAWVMYGSSGHETKPDGLVIENYKKRESESRLAKPGTQHFKAVIKPRFCYRTGVHYHRCLAGKTVDENGREIINQALPLILTHSKIRVNHYHCKSWEDYQKRQKRGSVASGSGNKFTRQNFEVHGCNDVDDPLMDRYIEALKVRTN